MNYTDIINMLLSDEYYKVKKDIYELVNDSHFIKYIIKVHNPMVFDRFIKMCEYKIDTSKLYERRNQFVQKIIFDLKENNIYSFFGLDNFDVQRSLNLSSRYLAEYIVGYYFQDNYYNFLTNFYQIIAYLRNSKKDLIASNHIKIYSEFIDLLELSFKDKINLFKKNLSNNLMEWFYDDINFIRNESHKELVNNTLKLKHDIKIYDRNLSHRLNIDVYYLNGEEFYGFVRCFSLSRDDLSNHEDYIWSRKNRLGHSFSYISDKNIGTIDYDGNSVILYYDNIDYHNIMYVHHADLHAKKMITQDDYLSEKENEIATPSSLIAMTNNYNEIYIKSSEKGIKPTALICYNSITDSDILFAKKYDLSILLINRQKYKRYETYEDDYNSYSYVI